MVLGKRGQVQGSQSSATSTNWKSGTSFCSWLRKGELRLHQTTCLLQTTPNSKKYKSSFLNWERIYSSHFLGFKSLCPTGTIVIRSSSRAWVGFWKKAVAAAVFVEVMNTSTLQVLIWCKIDLLPGSWLKTFSFSPLMFHIKNLIDTMAQAEHFSDLSWHIFQWLSLTSPVESKWVVFVTLLCLFFHTAAVYNIHSFICIKWCTSVCTALVNQVFYL